MGGGVLWTKSYGEYKFQCRGEEGVTVSAVKDQEITAESGHLILFSGSLNVQRKSLNRTLSRPLLLSGLMSLTSLSTIKRKSWNTK